jgi:molybdopterin-binding protein
MHISVRNQLAGTVKEVKLGAVIFFAPNYTSNVSIISDSKTLSA